jgi:hypothetical protein
MSSEGVKYCHTVSLEINWSEAETTAVKPKHYEHYKSLNSSRNNPRF